MPGVPGEEGVNVQRSTVEPREQRGGYAATSESGRQTVVFFALAYAISWSLWLPAVLGGLSSSSSLVFALFVVGACGPSLAAILLTALREGRSGVKALLGRLLAWRVGLRWYAIVLLGTPALGLLAVALHALFGGPPLGFSPAVPWFILPVAFLLGLLGGPLNEEIGWRGYALPRLQADRGALASSLVLGLVWGLWHLPAFFMAGTSQSELPLLPYLACVVALSVLFTWLYNGTGGSLVLAVLAHGAFNFTAGFLFPILPLGDETANAQTPVPPVGAEGPVPFLIFAALFCFAALLVVVLLPTGPARSPRGREV